MVAHEIIVKNGSTVSHEIVNGTHAANGMGVNNGPPVSNGTIVSGPPVPPELTHSFIIQPILYLDTLVSLGNIVLLMLLLYVYWDNYRRIKSNFTLGLIMFAGLLLLQNVLFSSFLLFHQAFRVAAIGLPLFIMNITEFLALIILLFITWK